MKSSTRCMILGVFALGARGGAMANELALSISSASEIHSYAIGDIVGLELQLNKPMDDVAGIDLNVSAASDAVRIRIVEFHEIFDVSIAKPSVTFPAKEFRDVRFRGSGDRGVGFDGRLALIELEVLDDQPFSAPVQIEAKLATVGRKQAPTVIRYDGPHEKIPNGIRILIENSPAMVVAPESPPGPSEAVAMGGGSSMTLGGLEGGAVATVSAPATNSALTLEPVQPSGDFPVGAPLPVESYSTEPPTRSTNSITIRMACCQIRSRRRTGCRRAPGGSAAPGATTFTSPSSTDEPDTRHRPAAMYSFSRAYSRG
jgi:hypothetical protein